MSHCDGLWHHILFLLKLTSWLNVLAFVDCNTTICSKNIKRRKRIAIKKGTSKLSIRKLNYGIEKHGAKIVLESIESFSSSSFLFDKVWILFFLSPHVIICLWEFCLEKPLSIHGRNENDLARIASIVCSIAENHYILVHSQALGFIDRFSVKTCLFILQQREMSQW